MTNKDRIEKLLVYIKYSLKETPNSIIFNDKIVKVYKILKLNGNNQNIYYVLSIIKDNTEESVIIKNFRQFENYIKELFKI